MPPPAAVPRAQSAARALLAALVLPLAGLGAQPIFPPPEPPAGNPQTRAKVLLGKALFWDEQMSSTRTVACGTCHVFGHGGADPREAVHPGADGVAGTDDDVRGSAGVVRHDRQRAFVHDPMFGLQVRVTRRKAPSVINAGYAAALFADGRAGEVFRDPTTGVTILPKKAALESQAVGPPVDDVEMGHGGRTWTDVAADLAPLRPLALAASVPATLQQFVAGQTYATLFQRVFGSPDVTAARIAFAIAAYERTLISDQSKYDLYLAGRAGLDAAEQAGLVKFQQFCIACHTDVDPAVVQRGPATDDFRNLGLRPVVEDAGRFAVTGDPRDRGRFKVPGLRNVALRAPYFHNGSAATLGDVVDFYARGGDFADNRDPLLALIPGHIDNIDRIMLQRFLEALTDPRVQGELPPFDRPTLWSETARAPARLGHGTPPGGGLAPRTSFNGPAFAGNAAFAVGVDRTAAGVPAVLLVDLAASSTPIRVLGLELWLGLTPNLVVIGAPTTTGNGPSTGSTFLRLPVPLDLLPGPVLFAQWLVADPGGPAAATCSEALAIPSFVP